MSTYQYQRFRKYRLYLMLTEFLSQTGLRIGEALALRWDDIEGERIRVERQASRDDNNTLVLTSLKNLSS